MYGDQIITGNLTVQGTTTTINSNVVITNDKNILLANNQSTSANIDGAGLDAGNAAGIPIATWRYSAASTSWQSNIGITPTANLAVDLGTNTLRWNNVYNGNVQSSGTVSAAGNITGNYFVGNGSALTGITSSYGNANVVANLAALGSNPVSTTGNVNAGNLIATTIVSAASHTGTVVSVTGNVTAGNLSTTGNITSAGNINGNISAVGNITGGNLTVNGLINTSGSLSLTGNISATGSIVASNVTLTAGGIYSTTGNVIAGNVTTSGLVSATGNVTANFFVGNGSALTGITSSYGNANVVANLAALGSNPVSTTGNINANNLIATTIVNAASYTGTIVSVTGNVTGNFFVGNGSALTGIVSSYGNANVVANLAALGSNPVSTTGNITASYFLGNGSQLTGLPATYGNANVVANLAALGSNPVSTTGNITANFFVGNGSALTGITSSYGNANVVANLAALGSNPISSTGNITTTGIVKANSFVQPPYTFGNATGTITPDINLGSIQTLTLTGNVTFNSIGNIITGQSAQFIMIQDATGSRALTSTMLFASNVRTLSTAANSIDLISVVYSGTTYYASLTRGYA